MIATHTTPLTVIQLWWMQRTPSSGKSARPAAGTVEEFGAWIDQPNVQLCRTPEQPESQRGALTTALHIRFVRRPDSCGWWYDTQQERWRWIFQDAGYGLCARISKHEGHYWPVSRYKAQADRWYGPWHPPTHDQHASSKMSDTPKTQPADAPCSAFVLSHFPKPCIPRKRHRCAVCDHWINVAEPCCRWSGIGADGPFTAHAHPACYDSTKGWDCCDWECPGTENGNPIEPRMFWPNV